MAQTIKEERLRWVAPIAKKEVRLRDVARVFPHGTRTLERWVAAYKQSGAAGLEPQSTAPKSHRKETSIRLKERVIALRKETKQCALKLHWRLAKDGVHIPTRTIGDILKRAGVVRKYRVRRVR